MFKRILKTLAFVALFTVGVSANQLKFLPVMDSSYTPNFAVAALGGYEKSNAVKGSGAYGVELSMTCPLLQIPDHTIRQQISLVHTNSEGLTTTSLELNPHVLFNVADNLNFGVGPSLGVVDASKNSQDHFVFGIGAGVSLTYDITQQYFVGLSSRYQWTNNAHLCGQNYDLDNTRTLLKFGVRF